MAFIAGGENSDGAQLLATGGEDGVLRVWELSADRNGATAALGNDTGGMIPNLSGVVLPAKFFAACKDHMSTKSSVVTVWFSSHWLCWQLYCVGSWR